MPPPHPTPPPHRPKKIVRVETKIYAIWGILWANLKKCSTLKFMMNISFVPSVCLHRSIILIFIEKEVCFLIFFPQKIYFSAIFNVHFCENPRFNNKFQALVCVCVCVFLCTLFVCVHVHACLCVYVCVCISERMSACVCICVYPSVYACANVNVCVCVHMSYRKIVWVCGHIAYQSEQAENWV